MLQLRDWYESGQYFQFDDYRIFYQEASPEKPRTLVLLHGFPTSSWDWRALWEELALEYRLVAPDFLGFGYSDKPTDYDYEISEQADLVESLLDSIGVTRYHLLAHDYGDTVAQELLARESESDAPLKIQSIILLNGGLFPETHQPRPIQKLLLSPIGKWLSPFLSRNTLKQNFDKIFGPNTQPSAREIDEWWSLIRYNGGQRVFHLLIRYMEEREQYRERWVKPLFEPPVMVRLIVGEADPISGGHMAMRYKELVRSPDIQLLPGVGHYPQTEMPKLVLEHCWTFWENL
jgi:pimeloyl-ACP methyl ester carboxylesterase